MSAEKLGFKKQKAMCNVIFNFKKAGITATIQTKTSVPKTIFYHLGKTNLIQIYILVRKCEAIEVVDVMRKAKWQ